MKKMSQDEIRSLQNGLKILESIVKQRNVQYASNLKTDEREFQFGKKSKENPGAKRMGSGEEQQFNVDMDFLLSQTTSNEKKGQYSSGTSQLPFASQPYNPSNHKPQLSFQQPSNLDPATQHLIKEFERLRYESEQVKQENQKLKEKNETLTFLVTSENSGKKKERKREKNKEEKKKESCQLSINELMQCESVQNLNQKLAEKNCYLEE